MRNRIGTILWGLFFIAIGVGYAGNQLEYWNFTLFFDGWWTLFIIVPCIISMVQSGIHTANVTGVIIGAALLAAALNDVSRDTIGKMVLPAVLVYVGLLILFRRHRSPADFVKEPAGFDKKNRSDYHSVFSGQDIIYPNAPFKGANLTAIFGGITLDLRNAQIDHAVTINTTSVFGGCEVILPPDVNVFCSNVPVFGGVGNERSAQHTPGNAVVYFNNVCIFGGTDIK